MKLKKYILILALTCFFGKLPACECGYETHEQHIEQSNIIVAGKIISKRSIVKKGYEKFEYKVEIEEKFKGQITKKVVLIRSGNGWGDCGFKFIVGKKYIIYGYKVDSTDKFFETDICTRTTEYNLEGVDKLKELLR